jgi:hypothetical protein
MYEVNFLPASNHGHPRFDTPERSKSPLTAIQLAWGIKTRIGDRLPPFEILAFLSLGRRCHD